MLDCWTFGSTVDHDWHVSIFASSLVKPQVLWPLTGYESPHLVYYSLTIWICWFILLCAFISCHVLSDFQEAEIKSLEAEIAAIQGGKFSSGDVVSSPELEKLRTENSKLKYQMAHLNRVSSSWWNDHFPWAALGMMVWNLTTSCLFQSVAAEEAASGDLLIYASDAKHAISILASLQEVFSHAIKAAYPDLEDPPIMVVLSSQSLVDYQCNSAMSLVKVLYNQSHMYPLSTSL